MTYISKSSIHINPTLPDPEDFGWVKNDDGYEPFMMDNTRKQTMILYVVTARIKDWCVQKCWCFNRSNVEFNKPEFELENIVRN